MFESRFNSLMPVLQKQLFDLYGHDPQFYTLLSGIVDVIQATIRDRGDELLERDRAAWCAQGGQSARIGLETRDELETLNGITFYVDLFSETLTKLEQKIPYLQSLGIRYVHLMPLFDCPEKENDGGYAVSSYRKIQKKIGTIQDLAHIASCFRKKGIRLVLDFVFNHTSDEHDFAKQARAGKDFYKKFFYIFEDEQEMESWNAQVREIFPVTRRGSFTYVKKVGGWVWTTFNSFQWDLNYSNPDVFLAMCKEMLFLANLGVDVLRLDALAFVWKEKGTNCENLPKAHTLIQAFRTVSLIACPYLEFKSEAIVHPDEVIKYISYNECRLSYNPLQMALFWEALATRDTRLLNYSFARRWHIPKNCVWVNYLRCHDDIGWTFSDEDAAYCGINGYEHRKFLNAFYTGRFEGSFAKGEAFQYNPETQDSRVCGSLASLAGLEQAYDLYQQGFALQQKDVLAKSELYAAMAVARIKMLFAVLCALPGIPLLYANDEYAALNDYSYKKNKSKQKDSRWVHRIPTQWNFIASLQNKNTDAPYDAKQWLEYKQKKIWKEIHRLLNLRTVSLENFSSEIRFVPCNDSRIFSFERFTKQNKSVLKVFANFSEAVVCIALENELNGVDMLSNTKYTKIKEIELQAYQVMWFFIGENV